MTHLTKLFAALFGMAMLLPATVVTAQAQRLATPNIDERIANQERRIRRGRARGELTRTEWLRLRGRIITIKSVRQVARLNGSVNLKERRRLRRMLNTNSARINRLRNNSSVDRRRFRRRN